MPVVRLTVFSASANSRAELVAAGPRCNPAWPEVGILAQRAKNRPNRIGTTVCELMRVRPWGEVLVRGRRAPIVGRVSMDQTTVDVSHIPGVRQGDEVVLIGEQGDERITAEDVAERLGTINYEVVSEILARVPRVV